MSDQDSASFDLLYRPDATVWSNLSSIAVYIDRFAKKLGIPELRVDSEKLTSVAGVLVRPDFPHADGLEQASPFKKAAYFFVWFVGERPILDGLKPEILGGDITGIPNHQNVIFAYHLAVDCLEGARIFRQDGQNVELTNRIKVSYHFYRDFVEAFSSTVPEDDFKKVSLLFEQLAYRDNDASYPQSI